MSADVSQRDLWVSARGQSEAARFHSVNLATSVPRGGRAGPSVNTRPKRLENVVLILRIAGSLSPRPFINV